MFTPEKTIMITQTNRCEGLSPQPCLPCPRHFFISSFLPLYIFHYSVKKHCFYYILFSFSVFFFFLFQLLNLLCPIVTSWHHDTHEGPTRVWLDAGIRVNTKARCGKTEILQDKNSLLTLTGRCGIVLKIIDTGMSCVMKNRKSLMPK